MLHQSDSCKVPWPLPHPLTVSPFPRKQHLISRHARQTCPPRPASALPKCECGHPCPVRCRWQCPALPEHAPSPLTAHRGLHHPRLARCTSSSPCPITNPGTLGSLKDGCPPPVCDIQLAQGLDCDSSCQPPQPGTKDTDGQPAPAVLDTQLLYRQHRMTQERGSLCSGRPPRQTRKRGMCISHPCCPNP